MPEMIAITLAAHSYSVRRLTLRQARAIGIGVSRQMPSAEDPGRSAAALDQGLEIVAVALSRDYPEMTQEKLLDMEIEPNEIIRACNAILNFSRPGVKEGDKSGEADPGAASTGPA